MGWDNASRLLDLPWLCSSFLTCLVRNLRPDSNPGRDGDQLFILPGRLRDRWHWVFPSRWIRSKWSVHVVIPLFIARDSRDCPNSTEHRWNSLISNCIADTPHRYHSIVVEFAKSESIESWWISGFSRKQRLTEYSYNRFRIQRLPFLESSYFLVRFSSNCVLCFKRRKVLLYLLLVTFAPGQNSSTQRLIHRTALFTHQTVIESHCHVSVFGKVFAGSFAMKWRLKECWRTSVLDSLASFESWNWLRDHQYALPIVQREQKLLIIRSITKTNPQAKSQKKREIDGQ